MERAASCHQRSPVHTHKEQLNEEGGEKWVEKNKKGRFGITDSKTPSLRKRKKGRERERGREVEGELEGGEVRIGGGV